MKDNNISLEGLKAHKKAKEYKRSEWYGIRSLLGYSNWANYFAILGARESGKSYSVMDFVCNQWKEYEMPFYWIRLKESATRKLLNNNAAKLVDADLKRKYNLDLTTRGDDVYDGKKKMCTVLALSTSYNTKGVAEFDKDYIKKAVLSASGKRKKYNWYNIICDEINFERGERITFDVAYAFITQLENLIRSTDRRVRIFLIGNNTSEVSDILQMFNFIPEKFGRYKLKSKRCVIDFLPCSKDYYARRSKAVLAPLTIDKELANYTNELKIDESLIDKSRLIKPTCTIHFTKSIVYTLWDNKIIAKYNGEKCNTRIAMTPYIDMIYTTEQMNNIVTRFDLRGFRYHDTMAFKSFEREIKFIKPRKS